MLRINVELDCDSEKKVYFQLVLLLIDTTSEIPISDVVPTVVPTPLVNVLEDDIAILRDQRWAETWQEWVFD
jgi:hypothetical protein